MRTPDSDLQIPTRIYWASYAIVYRVTGVTHDVQFVCQSCTIAESCLSRLRHGSSARTSSAKMRPAGHTGVSVEADTTAEATVAVVAAEDIEAAVAAVVATAAAALR